MLTIVRFKRRFASILVEVSRSGAFWTLTRIPISYANVNRNRTRAVTTLASDESVIHALLRHSKSVPAMATTVVFIELLRPFRRELAAINAMEPRFLTMCTFVVSTFANLCSFSRADALELEERLGERGRYLMLASAEVGASREAAS